MEIHKGFCANRNEEGGGEKERDECRYGRAENPMRRRDADRTRASEQAQVTEPNTLIFKRK